MAQASENQDYGETEFSWETSEYEKHERTKMWYMSATIIAFLLLLFSFLTANFLFAVIIIVAALVIIIHDGRDPEVVNISLTDEGIIVGRKFYDYDEFKDFSIVYKPKQDVKSLYFEFKNVVRPRLSISLGSINPLPVRKNLLKYLSEDLERTDQPLSEALAKIFKL
ncbi:MAG: hypothetical protein U9R06_01330 [Patescibacteria group bacterium]|nr:hypothetical protein [Patescibacteria group bacterium]